MENDAAGSGCLEFSFLRRGHIASRCNNVGLRLEREPYDYSNLSGQRLQHPITIDNGNLQSKQLTITIIS